MADDGFFGEGLHVVKLGDFRVRQNLSKSSTLKELKSTNINESGDRRPNNLLNTNTLYLC